MKLKFHQSMSGTNFNVTRGQELEVPDAAEAKRLIEAGIASEVKETSQASELQAIRKQLEELAQEVAELRVAITEATADDDEEDADEKAGKKSGKKS